MGSGSGGGEEGLGEQKMFLAEKNLKINQVVLCVVVEFVEGGQKFGERKWGMGMGRMRFYKVNVFPFFFNEWRTRGDECIPIGISQDYTPE